MDNHRFVLREQMDPAQNTWALSHLSQVLQGGVGTFTASSWEQNDKSEVNGLVTGEETEIIAEKLS